MKAAGHDPGHGGEAARKRGAKIAESNPGARLITTDDKRKANNDAARRYRERKKAVT
jgi:hypothetical protein